MEKLEQIGKELKILSDVLIEFCFRIEAVKSMVINIEEGFSISRYWLLTGTLVLVLFSLSLTLPKEDEKGALDKKEFREFELVEKENLSHDVRRFRFALQHKNQLLGLPIGQHISLCFVDSGKREVVRSYTPVSSDDERGYVDFVVKVYRPLQPNFPTGGQMSQHLDDMKLGDKILMRGPRGELDYQGQGNLRITSGFGKNKTTELITGINKLGMIAGGTGITPMLQVIRAVLKNPEDKTKIWLIFANKTEEDILLREELEALPKDRVKLYFVLDNPPVQWAGGHGFINEDMCKNHLPAPGSDVMVFNCGPEVSRVLSPSSYYIFLEFTIFPLFETPAHDQARNRTQSRQTGIHRH